MVFDYLAIKPYTKHVMKKRGDYRQFAKIHRALANEARLMIVESLEKRERTVGELTKLIGLDQSTVSKHLSILLSAGIVDNRKQANNVYYRLLIPCVMDMFSCTMKVLEKRRSL